MLFLLGLALGILAVIFTLQNVDVITVSFFSWHITGSLAVILLFTILSGVLIALLMVLPQSIGTYFEARTLRKRIKQLEGELEHQKQMTAFAHKTPATPSDIAHIEHGAIEKPMG